MGGYPNRYHACSATTTDHHHQARTHHPQGNILVDVPRWTPLLAQRLQQLGGVRWIFLTHRDDVGDHQAWAEATGAARIIHRSEANRRQGTE